MSFGCPHATTGLANHVLAVRWQVSAPGGEPGVEARGGPGSLSSPRGPAHPPLRSALHFQVRLELHSCCRHE